LAHVLNCPQTEDNFPLSPATEVTQRKVTVKPFNLPRKLASSLALDSFCLNQPASGIFHNGRYTIWSHVMENQCPSPIRVKSFKAALCSAALIIVLLCLCPGFVFAQAPMVAGTASVIDGDTITIHAQRIRLFGIDSPEGAQECIRSDGARWRCGQQAAIALQDYIDRRPVICRRRDIDRYGRIVGQCFVSGQDVSAWLVSNGWAVAFVRYSQDYLAQEGDARKARRGIWAGTFEMPWDWRRRRRH
jgi:endonuclease YncB( thermonuclease family)